MDSCKVRNSAIKRVTFKKERSIFINEKNEMALYDILEYY
jgi:hypothetical protein